MDIIVCIKQVAHIYVQNAFDSNTNQLMEDGQVHILNPYDEVAVEEALRIRESDGCGSVKVLSVGPERAEKALRWCLAMGADKAVHVVDDTAPDKEPWVIAGILAKVIQQDECHLILCGRMATDSGMGQVGIFLSELLGLPVVTTVTALDFGIASKKALIKRSLERGNREAVECGLPAVFTVDKSLNRPRYPTLPGRVRAQKMPVEKIGTEHLGPYNMSGKIKLWSIAPPRLRPKKILAPESGLSAANRLQFVMSGGIAQKKGGQIGGNPGGMATGIFNFLKEKNFLPEKEM